MKLLLLFAFTSLLALQSPALALSTPIERDIDFPKDYDSARAEAIRAVIRDPRFAFAGGIVSHWPPDFGTRLSFNGDATSLKRVLCSREKAAGNRDARDPVSGTQR
jgi:hypothetical protein